MDFIMQGQGLDVKLKDCFFPEQRSWTSISSWLFSQIVNGAIPQQIKPNTVGTVQCVI